LSRMHERVGHCVALYRKPAYSPQQHLANDTAILDAVAAGLEGRGWRVTRSAEQRAESGALPSAGLYLNMCQGARASGRLVVLEREGALFVNRPASVLGCHRHQLVRTLAGDVAFPPTVIVPTWLTYEAAQTLAHFLSTRRTVWVKRGDVHAERAEDVVPARPDQVPLVIASFAARGVARVAVQEHVPGPVIKFYGVADRRFFRYYDAKAGPDGPAPVLDEERLQALAFGAAARVGLGIFGGDVALPAPDRPVLIDLNDWPSFAPFRAEAALAIARFVHEHAQTGVAA
jgi:hypothetical protein